MPHVAGGRVLFSEVLLTCRKRSGLPTSSRASCSSPERPILGQRPRSRGHACLNSNDYSPAPSTGQGNAAVSGPVAGARGCVLERCCDRGFSWAAPPRRSTWISTGTWRWASDLVAHGFPTASLSAISRSASPTARPGSRTPRSRSSTGSAASPRSGSLSRRVRGRVPLGPAPRAAAHVLDRARAPAARDLRRARDGAAPRASRPVHARAPAALRELLDRRPDAGASHDPDPRS